MKFYLLLRGVIIVCVFFVVVLMVGNVINMLVLLRGFLGKRFYLEIFFELFVIWIKYGYDDILKDWY